MKIEEAIEILQVHNRWRRGLIDKYPYTPTQIGLAIDIVLSCAKKACVKKHIKNEPINDKG